MGLLDPNERFEQLHRLHAKELERRLGSMQPWVPRSIHQDILQDVWIVVHRKLAEVPTDDGVRPWLIAILRNELLHYARSYVRARRKTEALGEVESMRRDDGLRVENGHFLAQILGDLPDDQREVVIRSAMYGESAPEIAAQLRKPVNTVYSRLRLARERISRIGVAFGLWVAWLRADASNRLVLNGLAAAAVAVSLAASAAAVLLLPSDSASAIRSDDPQIPRSRRPAYPLHIEGGTHEAVILRPSMPAAPTGPSSTALIETIATDDATPQLAPEAPPAVLQEATRIPLADDDPRKQKDRDVTLLKRASTALQGGNAKLALRLARKHRRLFPRHDLGYSAASIEIDALCLLKRPDEAQKAFDRAAAVFPEAVLQLTERKKRKCW